MSHLSEPPVVPTATVHNLMIFIVTILPPLKFLRTFSRSIMDATMHNQLLLQSLKDHRLQCQIVLHTIAMAIEKLLHPSMAREGRHVVRLGIEAILACINDSDGCGDCGDGGSNDRPVSTTCAVILLGVPTRTRSQAKTYHGL